MSEKILAPALLPGSNCVPTSLLSYLPGSLETLELPSCVLLNTDLCSLSRSPLASHLKKLDLSNNDLAHIASGVLGALLRGTSGTLQELLLKNCNMRDIHLLAILPALSCCFHLHSLSLCGNCIWKSSLTHLIQLVAGLSELKLLVCPLPVECYKYVQSTALYCLQPQQFICVKTMVRERLRALGRENLEWTFTLPTLWCDRRLTPTYSHPLCGDPSPGAAASATTQLPASPPPQRGVAHKQDGGALQPAFINGREGIVAPPYGGGARQPRFCFWVGETREAVARGTPKDNGDI
ncbi:hypothetical protein HPG69_012612 [Diceros bicornis minor]|uniref:Uncharacterized protein n=1 Tax=Diceros bicornis minor TaxID=77932 RepID=A0A7J7F8X5_DICBM|nr:hypothetical protein HPG69_012612 [Diceros bicornis minor]